VLWDKELTSYLGALVIFLYAQRENVPRPTIVIFLIDFELAHAAYHAIAVASIMCAQFLW
jgi:hypothetical protein